MDKRIVLLLTGTCADLFASLRAMELAKRLRGAVQALVIRAADQPLGPGGTESPTGFEVQRMLRWWGEITGVVVCCHLLEGDTKDELLLDFLLTYQPACLVVGAPEQAALEKTRSWCQELQLRLINDRRWYRGPFWTLIASPLDDRDLELVMDQVGPGEQEP